MLSGDLPLSLNVTPTLRRSLIPLAWRRLRFAVEMNVSAQRQESPRKVRLPRATALLVKPREDLVDRAIYLNGVHEFTSVNVMLSLLREGMNVIDVGAHIGQFSIFAARRVGATGQVVAVEPHPTTVRRLQSNLDLNQVRNVRVVSVALWNRQATIPLYLPLAHSHSGASVAKNFHGSPAHEILVDAQPLDAVLARIGMSRVDFMKIDVEGAESDILHGAVDALSTRPCILFEVNELVVRQGQVTNGAIDLLRQLGYDLYAMTRWRLSKVLAGEDPRKFALPLQALNLVAIHPESAVYRGLGL